MLGVAADDRQPHAGHGLHAEAPEHADVAVTAADQDDVTEDGLIRGLHYDGAFMARVSSLADRWMLRESMRRANIESSATAERGRFK